MDTRTKNKILNNILGAMPDFKTMPAEELAAVDWGALGAEITDALEDTVDDAITDAEDRGAERALDDHECNHDDCCSSDDIEENREEAREDALDCVAKSFHKMWDGEVVPEFTAQYGDLLSYAAEKVTIQAVLTYWFHDKLSDLWAADRFKPKKR